MKLPFLNNKPKLEYFLALVLRDDKINAFIFQEQQDTIKIVNSQEEAFSDSLDKTSFDELLDATDKVISQAEDELNLSQEVQKTIFGLKESWVKDAKIKPENLQILKKLSDNLGLQPVGFLTFNEAVVSLLQKEEGAPPSAIFIDVGKNNVTVASVRAGKVVEVKTAEIHQSPVFTVDTLLKHFEIVEILPAKVVLLNEDEDLVQEFIGHQWSKSLPFLNLPQIVSLQSDSIAKAFAIGLANQTGVQVVSEFEVEEKPVQPVQVEDIQTVQEKIEPEIEHETAPVVEEIQSNIKLVDAPDFFGFSNKDVAKSERPAPVSEPVQPETFEEIPEEVAIEEEKKELVPPFIMILLLRLKNFAALLLTKIKGVNAGGIKIPTRGPLLFAIALFVFLLLFVVYYLFFIKATVVLSITPKFVEKNEDLTFADSSNFKEKTIKGDFVTQGEDGSASDNTTGKKETGDKAKGTVTIKNYGQQTITLSSGTKLTSTTNSLGFLTTSDVKVASRSGDTIDSKTVNVEAEKFGTEYNLPSQAGFSSGNSDLTIKNDSAFSGGTKKEIQVVSKDDVSKITDDLIKSLTEKAKNDILEKTSGKDLLPDFTDVSLSKKTLDKDVGEEAKTVKLTGTVDFEFLSYDKNELLNFLKTVVPSSETVEKENLELKFENIKKTKDGNVTTTVNAKIKILPKLDKDSLAKKISGKSFESARSEILTNQINDAAIRFSPNLGFLPKFLPRNSRNIQIKIVEE